MAFEPSSTVEQEVVINKEMVRRLFEEEQMPNKYNEELIRTYIYPPNKNDIREKKNYHTKSHLYVSIERNEKPFFDKYILQCSTNGYTEKWKELSTVDNLQDIDATSVQDITKSEIVTEYFPNEHAVKDDYKNFQEATKDNIDTMDKLLHEKSFMQNIFNEYDKAYYRNNLLVTPWPSVFTNDLFEDLNETDDQHTLLPEFATRILQTEKEPKLINGSTVPLRTKLRLIETFSAHVLSTTEDIFLTKTQNDLFSLSLIQPQTTLPHVTNLEIKTVDPVTVYSLIQNLTPLTPPERTKNQKVSKMHPTRSIEKTKANVRRTKNYDLKVAIGDVNASITYSNVPTSIKNTDTWTAINETIGKFTQTLFFTRDILPSLPAMRDNTNRIPNTEITQPNQTRPTSNSFDLCKNSTAYISNNSGRDPESVVRYSLT